MENMSVEQLISSLAALAGDSRNGLFGGQDKLMVDRSQFLTLVEALQRQYPVEIAEAKNIVENSNLLRTNAKNDAAKTRREADQVLKDAEILAAQRVEESEIVKQARAQEKEILENAEQQRKMLIDGAVRYADSIMEGTDQVVAAAYAALDSGIANLTDVIKHHRESALADIDDAREALKKATSGQ